MADILLSALAARRGGALTYLRHILPAFPGGDHRLFVLATRRIDGMGDDDGRVTWLQAPGWTERPLLRMTLGWLWFRFLWPWRGRFDAVFYANGTVETPPPPGAAFVIAFRNMAPFDPDVVRRYPALGWARLRNTILRRSLLKAFARADLVIFISNYAQQVIDVLTHRQGRAEVIVHGVALGDDPLSPAIAARLPARFVLYLSVLEAYKAQIEAVEAWAKLRELGRRTDVKLVLAGPEYGPYADEVRATIARLDLVDDVILLGPVPHAEVAALVRLAELNLFLSTCENCPNILLELMRAGVPLLVSAREPMPELGGPDLDYVEPYDVDAVAAGIARLLDDPARREAMAAAAYQRSLGFDWGTTAERTWAAVIGEATRVAARRGKARRA